MARTEAGCDETLGTTGAGRWGGHSVRFATSMVRRTWRARHGDEVRTSDRARLTFQLDGGEADLREFESEAERDEFLARSISDRVPTDLADEMLLGCRAWGDALVGDELAGVSFVMDYLQLQFQGGVANLYVWPEVQRAGEALAFGDAGYRDGLCGFIGDRVSAAGVFLDDGAVITFERGELIIPPELIRGAGQPEVVEGHGGEIWSADPPFA